MCSSDLSAFANRMVDNLEMDSLCAIALDYLEEQYGKLTDAELRAEVAEYAEDLLEEDDE
mgnify:CR=1 FL=1